MPFGEVAEVELAAEVQQCALAHLGASATAFHEAVGMVILADGAAGEGTADEHGVDGSGGGDLRQP